jgi:hypothetical protein
MDMDEFIVPLKRNSIPELLEGYEKHPGPLSVGRYSAQTGTFFPRKVCK